MHGYEFASNVLLIPLGGYDLVLGIQWLATLGTIKWNFKSLKMEFYLNGRHYVLRALKTRNVQMMTQVQLLKAFKTAAYLCMLQLGPRAYTEDCTLLNATTMPIPVQLQSLLQ